MNTHLQTSKMAESLIGSEIIKLAWEINDRIKKGEKIYNLTIGDYKPSQFPIPVELKEEIQKAYEEQETNYPPADGLPELREQIIKYIIDQGGQPYAMNEISVAGGSRPLIYAIYKTLLDPDEKALFPVPSWNNNHYVHLTPSQKIEMPTSAENMFMPSVEDIRPHLKSTTLLALCSPLNPTGTCFTKAALKEICLAVLEENRQRAKEGRKALYLMYDQIYWGLHYKGNEHADPLNLVPELRDYVIYIHGISKVFAGTGVRVGWAWGPEHIISKMKSVLGHIGAWAPRAEQLAVARFLSNKKAVHNYLSHINEQVDIRLEGFYNGFEQMRKKGLAVQCLPPQGAIYLTVLFDVLGKKTETGAQLEKIADVSDYILAEAKTALVPFSAFGAKLDKPWYRLSVGTCSVSEVGEIIQQLEAALTKLK